MQRRIFVSRKWKEPEDGEHYIFPGVQCSCKHFGKQTIRSLTFVV
jgi:hypothetical protein